MTFAPLRRLLLSAVLTAAFTGPALAYQAVVAGTEFA